MTNDLITTRDRKLVQVERFIPNGETLKSESAQITSAYVILGHLSEIIIATSHKREGESNITVSSHIHFIMVACHKLKVQKILNTKIFTRKYTFEDTMCSNTSLQVVSFIDQMTPWL